MIFGFKKRAALFFACAALLVNFGSCRIYKKERTPPPVSEPPIADFENAEEIAIRLAAEDMQMIDFLVNLTAPDGEYIFGEMNDGLWYVPVTIPEYADFDDLLDRLDSIYISAEVYSPFFRYPMFGEPQIENFGGEIYIYPHYFSNFEAKIDSDSIKIAEFAEGSAEFTFGILNHAFFTEGSLSMTKTPGGWRLDESFFFYCQKRLDLLDIENSVSWEQNPILDTAQNVGSAKRFIGDCMFYNIFIGDCESSWDPTSVGELYALQNEAFRYLEAQAGLFGHELRCYATDAQNALYIDTDTCVYNDADYHYWLDIFLMDTEYGSLNGLLEALLANGPAFDNYGLIININKRGRSYAVSCDPAFDDYEEYYAERAVIYYTDDMDYDYVLCSATIAHEILHLFGAVDLYYPNDGEDIRKQLIIQYFPFEIMHYIPFYTDDATVSAFTAFRVGWRNTLPEQLMMFQAKG
jgi:hypothetical protein